MGLQFAGRCYGGDRRINDAASTSFVNGGLFESTAEQVGTMIGGARIEGLLCLFACDHNVPFHTPLSIGGGALAVVPPPASAALKPYKLAVMPPSTYKMWPVTKLDAAEARNTAAPPSSCTSPQRPAGVRLLSHAVKASSATSACVSSVLK